MFEARRGHAALVLVLLLGGFGCAKKADAAQSRNLFASACARCHGSDGAGGVPLFAGGPSPRDFRDHEFQRTHTDDQLKLTIVNGKGQGMPGFGATFDDAQLLTLVAQVRSFDTEVAK